MGVILRSRNTFFRSCLNKTLVINTKCYRWIIIVYLVKRFLLQIKGEGKRLPSVTCFMAGVYGFILNIELGLNIRKL